IRFAWKKVGGNSIALALANKGNWTSYYAMNYTGSAPGSKTVSIPGVVPTQWVQVTRDLYQDFGQIALSGLCLCAVVGHSALFAHSYLGRTIADLDRVTQNLRQR